MALGPKDNSRKSGSEKPAARKSTETKKTTSKSASAEETTRKSVDAKSSRAAKSTDEKEKTVADAPVKKTSAKAAASKTAEPTTGKSAEKKTAKKTSRKSGKSAPKTLESFMEFLKSGGTARQNVLNADAPLLNHFAFAVVLENANFDQTRKAYDEIYTYFIDWNEVRVSRANEILQVIGNIPNGLVVGERMRRILQTIFEKIYKFDLEDYRQQGPKAVEDFLASIPYTTRFALDYVKFFVLDEDSLPLSEASLQVLRLLGFVKVVDDREELDMDGVNWNHDTLREFFFLLHEFASGMLDVSRAKAVLSQILEFDPEAESRSPKPLVEQKTTDPLEIARQLARKIKDGAAKAPAAPVFDSAVDSDIDEDSDDYSDSDIDESDGDSSDDVAETDLSPSKTNYRSGEKSSRAAASRRRERAVSADVDNAAAGDAIVPDPASDSVSAVEKAPRKTRKSSASDAVAEPKAEKKTRKSAKSAATESDDAPAADVEEKTARAKMEITKKSKDAATEKSAPVDSSVETSEKTAGAKRRAKADSSNVASSEPPDSLLSADAAVAKPNRSASAAARKGDADGKDAKRSKSRSAASKSVSSKDASKLKEIQQKKPR